ncbi:WYL domain-containing protein [Aliikangiella sp. IMCC44359]|uniref:WYL domain-containing protein n=1 Tax=Aliikangiella sp. IMCC44359 TaxID=3459125 RepID=UPI00403AB98C
MLGLSQIFPSFDKLIFSQLSTERVAPFLFRNIKIEDTTGYEETFKSITLVIQERRKIKFHYKQKTYNEVCPYRLINDHGWWYLAAVHNGTLKSFKVLNIGNVAVSNHQFALQPEIEKQVTDGCLKWVTDSPIEIVLRIDSTIAGHFRKTNILPSQQLLKDLDDGSLLVTSSITDQKQIIPILKYWLPDIEILSPAELKQSLLVVAQT